MSITPEEKKRLAELVADHMGVALPSTSYNLDDPSVTVVTGPDGEKAVIVYESTDTLMEDAEIPIPVKELSLLTGNDRVVIVEGTSGITADDFVAAFNKKYNTRLLTSSLSADTLANFPLTTPFNGLKVTLDPSEVFYKGTTVVTVDSTASIVGEKYISTPPQHTVLLGYYTVAPADALEIHHPYGKDVTSLFTPFRNVTTINTFTVYRMFKVSGGRLLIQGDFDIEVVFDNTVGPVAIPDGTMMLVDKTGLVLSVDTTPLNSSDVYVTYHEDHDNFVCLYNVSGNFTVIKSYPYDLTQAPVTSTLPIGPISTATMDSNGNVFVGTRPDTSSNPVVTRVRRLLQANYAYSMDNVFNTIELTNAYNSTDSTEVVSIALTNIGLVVYYSPVTYFSRELFDPVINGTALRTTGVLDLELFFGYIPVLTASEDGTIISGYEANRPDFTEGALEVINPVHPADGTVLDPLSDFERFLIPSAPGEPAIFSYLRSVDSGPTGKTSVMFTSVTSFSHYDHVLKVPGFDNRYPHIVRLCDYTPNGAIAFVTETYDNGDPLDPTFRIHYKEKPTDKEFASIRLGKGIIPPDFIMLLESSE